MAPTRVRFSVYDYVTRQAKNKALCPFCNVWHSSADGKALAGDCKGIYVRSRKAAFVVVALKKGRAGVVDGVYSDDFPEGRNLERAKSHAIKAHYEA